MSSQRSSVGMIVLVALAVGGSAAGVMVWQLMQSGPAPALDRSGFDVQVVEEAGPRGPAPAQPAAQQSSLTSFTGAPSGMSFGEQAPDSVTGGPSSPAGPKKPRDVSFREAVLAAERKGYDLAVAYTKKYPSIAQYGRDWMSHPDLRQLNYDYLRDRDPVKFLRGLAKSPNFPKLVKKYATDPGIHAFVKDAAVHAPAGLAGAAADYLTEDSAMKNFMQNVTRAMGLPGSLTASLFGGDDKPLDQKQLMGEVMQGNPELQKALNNPALQNNPDLQKALQGQGSR